MNCSICGRTLGTSLKCECDNPRGLTYVPSKELKRLSISPFINPVPTVANMTLRDYFAGQALLLLQTNRIGDATFEHLSGNAYKIADAMLAARAALALVGDQT